MALPLKDRKKEYKPVIRKDKRDRQNDSDIGVLLVSLFIACMRNSLKLFQFLSPLGKPTDPSPLRSSLITIESFHN